MFARDGAESWSIGVEGEPGMVSGVEVDDKGVADDSTMIGRGLSRLAWA
jgi:hypothetical protein